MVHIDDDENEYDGIVKSQTDATIAIKRAYSRDLEMITEADNRIFFDDIQILFTQAAKANTYSTWLLVQFMLIEYRHDNFRMYNIWKNNGFTKFSYSGHIPNDRLGLAPLYFPSSAAMKILLGLANMMLYGLIL